MASKFMNSETPVKSSPTLKKKTNPSLLKTTIGVYSGYIEKSYRLVFEYSKVTDYPRNTPLLSTILDSGIIEEVAKPLIQNEDSLFKGKSLISFNTPKTIHKIPTQHQVKTKIFLKIDKFLHKHLEHQCKSLLTIEIINTLENRIDLQFPQLIGQELKKQLLVMSGHLISKKLLLTIYREIKKSLSPKLTQKMIQKLLNSFIWKQKDHHVLVHTWPVEFNQQFKKSFQISNKYIHGDPIFNDQYFPPEAIQNFRYTCHKLFGRGCVSNENPIHLCYREKDHQCPVIRGLGGQLLEMIPKKKGLMSKLKIKEVNNNSNSHSFTSIIEINGNVSGDKTFYIDPKEDYILYIKSGYQTMAMMTPSKDFLRNNELMT